jgi:hypothetical protein
MRFAKIWNPDEAARKRTVAAKVAGLWSALARAKKSGNKHRVIRAVEKCLLCCSSEQRLVRLILAVADQPPEIFWPVWLDHWSHIDYSGELHHYLPSIFKRQGSALPHMRDEAKAKFDSLPDVVTVYRGCDEQFKDGVSWTTDRKVAGYFAAGGRYGRPSRPVIVTGRIEKYSPDFYYCNDARNEAEIVCTPAIEKVEPYFRPWPGDEEHEIGD